MYSERAEGRAEIGRKLTQKIFYVGIKQGYHPAGGYHSTTDRRVNKTHPGYIHHEGFDGECCL